MQVRSDRAASGGRPSEGGNAAVVQNKPTTCAGDIFISRRSSGEDVYLPESIFEHVLKRKHADDLLRPGRLRADGSLAAPAQHKI